MLPSTLGERAHLAVASDALDLLFPSGFRGQWMTLQLDLKRKDTEAQIKNVGQREENVFPINLHKTFVCLTQWCDSFS